MSQQPQRWNIDANVAPHDAGQWVTWEDYCRLKAENERLRKAGDAMASIIKYHPDANAFDPVPDVVKRWLAAKDKEVQS